MLEEKIEALFNTIKDRQHKWCKYKELFGEDDALTQDVFKSLYGLEEAFVLLSGHTYTDHLIAYIKNISVAM